LFTKTTALRVLFAGAAVTAAGALSTGIASADDQQWNVTNLAPSSDRIDYTPVGTLWEATATGTGAGVPFIPGFSARGGGDSYTVLWGVATPRGVNPSGLEAGQSVTGKLYFDVTGARPNQVAFNDGNGAENVWGPWQSGPGAAPRTPAAPTIVRPNSVPAPMPAQNAAPKAAPAPAAAPATGSSGTPISAGTPAAAEAPATPAAATPATPAPAAATPAAATPATPAPAAATPAPAAPASTAPAAPAPASATPAPASTAAPAPTSGSSGTPLTAPTTSVMPVPAS